MPIVLPSGRTTAVFRDHGRTVCARQRPKPTPSNRLVRICKAGVESSILFVSTVFVALAGTSRQRGVRFEFPDGDAGLVGSGQDVAIGPEPARPRTIGARLAY